MYMKALAECLGFAWDDKARKRLGKATALQTSSVKRLSSIGLSWRGTTPVIHQTRSATGARWDAPIEADICSSHSRCEAMGFA
jgi:hypothetical protein